MEVQAAAVCQNLQVEILAAGFKQRLEVVV